MSSPWSSGADSGSIWNSNSPNLNLLRRYSLRTSSSTTPTTAPTTNNNIGNLNSSPSSSSSPINSSHPSTSNQLAASSLKSTCSWEPSADGKYLVGYMMISRQDLGIYHAALGFQLCGGKLTHDCQLGAIVEHVVPGSLANIVCKLKVGDEIVEWNGHDLRNKRNDEVCDIIESAKNTHSLRLVAIRPVQNNNNNNNNNNNGGGGNSTTNNNNNSSSSSQQNSANICKVPRPVD